MAAKVSQLLTPTSLRDGKEIKTSVATIEPGLLVTQDSSGSTVSLATATSGAYGIAYGNRYQPYAPTTRVFASGEPLTVIWGDGEMLLSSDFFVGGSLPSVRDTLYPGASGLWSNTQTGGSTLRSGIVGTVKAIVNRLESVGGVGANQQLAHVRFHIVP